MTYSILRMIDLMDDQFPLLLNAVLERMPVIIAGEDIELVDDITESITTLCSHRHKLVFWRDFTSQSEILAVWEEEKHNYEVNRTIVCGLSGNLRLALDRISRFTGWVLAIPLGSTVLGIEVTEKTLDDVVSHILRNSGNCGILRVSSPSSMNFSLIRPSDSTLDVEKRIVSKILIRKKQSLERIRRLLTKSLRWQASSDRFRNGGNFSDVICHLRAR